MLEIGSWVLGDEGFADPFHKLGDGKCEVFNPCPRDIDVQLRWRDDLFWLQSGGIDLQCVRAGREIHREKAIGARHGAAGAARRIGGDDLEVREVVGLFRVRNQRSSFRLATHAVGLLNPIESTVI